MTTTTIPGAQAWSATPVDEAAAVGVAVVHGLTGNPNSTRPLGEHLAAAGHTVEVPLLPGHGTSVRDLARTRYADWHDAVARVVDDLAQRCDRVVLVGLSMGATLVLDVAADPQRAIAGVVAINAQVLDPTQPLAKAAPVLQHLTPILPRDLAGLPSDDIAMPGGDEHAYRHVSAKAAQSLIRELPRVRRRLAGLDVPLLVAYSPRDHTVPARNSEALLTLTASTDVTPLVLERSYHVATLDYDADLLAGETAAFVARVTAR